MVMATSPLHSKVETRIPKLLHLHSQEHRGRQYDHVSIRYSRSSSSSSVGSRNNSSVQSVPSLFQAVEPLKRDNDDTRLAFTTQDLELTPKNSSIHAGTGSTSMVGHHQPTVASSPTTGSMKPNKKRFVRHGLMMASTSDLLDSMNKPNVIGISSTVNDSSKDSNSVLALASSPSCGAQVRARPTVTTILRQQHVLEKVERQEKDKLDSLMLSTVVHLEVDTLTKEQEQKRIEEAKTAEARRLLQTKLAYERAIAASRKVADEKQKIAESTRQKEKEWQFLLEKQRVSEKERLKSLTESLQRANTDSKRAFDEMLRSKQLRAHQVKQETEQLQAEARLKKQEEERQRQDKIQQIQALKLALKRTKETSSNSNPNQFYRSIAIPETQIKLRLQKEEEKRKLQETRQKIQAAKQLKSVKLIRAMKKIQSCESLARRQQREERKPMSAIVLPSKLNERPFTFPSKASISYLKADVRNNNTTTDNRNNASTITTSTPPKDAEFNEMLEQLKQLRTENYQQRLHERNQLAQAAASTTAGGRSSVKIIGARSTGRIEAKNKWGRSNNNNNNYNNNNNVESSKSSNSFYRHRSHYGIHV